jgi:hypothetical protein
VIAWREASEETRTDRVGGLVGTGQRLRLVDLQQVAAGARVDLRGPGEQA